jgi:hypothetical protein
VLVTISCPRSTRELAEMDRANKPLGTGRPPAVAIHVRAHVLGNGGSDFNAPLEARERADSEHESGRSQPSWYRIPDSLQGAAAGCCEHGDAAASRHRQQETAANRGQIRGQSRGGLQGHHSSRPRPQAGSPYSRLRSGAGARAGRSAAAHPQAWSSLIFAPTAPRAPARRLRRAH